MDDGEDETEPCEPKEVVGELVRKDRGVRGEKRIGESGVFGRVGLVRLYGEFKDRRKECPAELVLEVRGVWIGVKGPRGDGAVRRGRGRKGGVERSI
jgi:hypothetical protein